MNWLSSVFRYGTIRDDLVIAIILLSVPIVLFNAYFGVLMWTWIAYFNPHRYAWGIAKFFFSPAMVIGIPTLLGTLFAPKNIRLFTRETVLLAGLWLWLAFTTFYISHIPEFVGHVADATAHLEDVSKILLMTFLTILLVTSKKKLRGLVLVILASFGVRALFAAVWFIRTGGQFQVLGPPGTFLEDNNDFALALNMTIPMFFFMARAEPKLWMRIGLRVLMVCVIFSVIGTYSRGGLVGLAVVTLAILAKSRQKIISLLLVAIALLCIVTFSTTAWKDRMSQFLQGNLDGSAYGRLVAWGGAWNLAMDYPITGGGFDVFTDEDVFPQYVPPSLRSFLYTKLHHLHSSHSIYFGMLGEQGFVGLGLFMALLVSSYASLRGLRSRAKTYRNLGWVVPYTHMFEVTLLAYMTSGATLGRAYFDFFYQVIACVILLKILAKRDLRVTMPERQPVEGLEAVAA